MTVVVEEDLSMPRSRRTASRLAYFLASRGRTGSMYPCFLGVAPRGGLIRGTGLGTITFVTVIIPDFGVGGGIAADVEEVDVDGVVEDAVDIVASVVVDVSSEPDLLEELEEFVDEGVGVMDDVRERRVESGVFAGVEVVGMNIGEREVGGRGLAEAVRGGKIVE